VAVEYLPAPQFVQEVEAISVEYLPALQSAQVLALAAPMAVEYLPALQSVHAALPMADLYLPAIHAEHVPPSAPVYPILHTQLLKADEPAGDCELGLQLTHALLLDCPVVVEYVFALQFRHAVAPDNSTYLPASQLEHNVDPLLAL